MEQVPDEPDEPIAGFRERAEEVVEEIPDAVRWQAVDLVDDVERALPDRVEWLAAPVTGKIKGFLRNLRRG